MAFMFSGHELHDPAPETASLRLCLRWFGLFFRILDDGFGYALTIACNFFHLPCQPISFFFGDIF